MLVEPGDTCYLDKGDYEHDGLTRTHGTADAPITITGHKEACIKGSNTQDRVLQIAHDYYVIDSLCFDGQHGSDYVATAIYVLGADHKTEKNGVTSSVTGLKLTNLEIKNFDSECVHFRYFVTHAEMEGCTVQHCGIGDFDGGGGGKVGEAVYVGTALDQVGDGKVSIFAWLSCTARTYVSKGKALFGSRWVARLKDTIILLYPGIFWWGAVSCVFTRFFSDDALAAPILYSPGVPYGGSYE